MSEYWAPIAELCQWTTFVVVALPAARFLYQNFVVREINHPLDYYSNRLRTKPPIFLFIIVVLLGGAGLSANTGELSQFLGTVPELAIVVYLQGWMHMISAWFTISAAAGLVAALLYAIAGACAVLVVLIPTPPGDEPGWVYSVAYLGVQLVSVGWVRVGVRRHLNNDNGGKIVPDGAELLAMSWEWVVCRFVPVLLVGSNVAFLLAYVITNETQDKAADAGGA